MALGIDTARYGLLQEIVDGDSDRRSVDRFREAGVDAKIVLAFGNRFPMIDAHKVLAAYSCLVPRVVSGQLDSTWGSHRTTPYRGVSPAW
jgi:hypothetical protein